MVSKIEMPVQLMKALKLKIYAICEANDRIRRWDKNLAVKSN